VRVGLDALDERAEMVTTVAPLVSVRVRLLDCLANGLRACGVMLGSVHVIASSLGLQKTMLDPSYPAWNARRRVLP
jgi:hypothetical protein